MTEHVDEKSKNDSKKRERGTGFPLMNLGAAVDAIVTIGRNGANHTHDAASTYLGHSTANSGAFRNKLAALRDWGLIERGDRNRVILSDLAKDLVLKSGEDGERELISRAFESCRVFDALYEDSAKSVPMDTHRLRTVAVMRLGVASEQADRFVDNFADSAVYAGLAKFDGDRITLLPRDAATADADDEADTNDDAVPVTPANTPAPQRPGDPVLLSPSAAVPIALRQAWPIDGGEIEFIIRTPKAMPAGIYELMAKMAEVATEMERLLKPEPAKEPWKPDLFADVLSPGRPAPAKND